MVLVVPEYFLFTVPIGICPNLNFYEKYRFFGRVLAFYAKNKKKHRITLNSLTTRSPLTIDQSPTV